MFHFALFSKYTDEAVLNKNDSKKRFTCLDNFLEKENMVHSKYAEACNNKTILQPQQPEQPEKQDRKIEKPHVGCTCCECRP
ncbi:MAG: hypothetical protein CL947_00790 [Epsilonproteobacteria bacterium]|nr:hypothetical protein [Campylobacterota bacterium]